MSKFTPGKWHLHPSGKANLLGDFTVFYGSGETSHNQICQAKKDNARLIAAAPEMYDLLVQLVKENEMDRIAGIMAMAEDLLKEIDG